MPILLKNFTEFPTNNDKKLQILKLVENLQLILSHRDNETIC